MIDAAANRWANEYVGMPFKPLGRDDSGVDCYGLVRLVYLDQLGITLPLLLDDYEGTTPKHAEEMEKVIKQEVSEEGRWLPVIRGQEEPFDVIVANIIGNPVHCAIVVRKNLLLHIRHGANATTEDYRRGMWTSPKRISGIFRYKDLCNI